MRGLDRLFEVHATAGSVEFPGVTLRDGYSDDHGGAILNARSGAVVVSESALERNVAGKTGGGIFPDPAQLAVNREPATCTVPSPWLSTITGNSGQTGGGIYNDGGITPEQTFAAVTIDRTTIANNTAAAHGGGVGNTGEGQLTPPTGSWDAGQAGRPRSQGRGGVRRVRIPRHWLRMRRGVATIKLACPGPGQVCAGRIALRVPTAARAASASRWLVLGSTRYRIRGGDTTRVRVRLSERRWARVRRRRGVRVQAVITARGSAVRATVALRVRSGGS